MSKPRLLIPGQHQEQGPPPLMTVDVGTIENLVTISLTILTVDSRTARMEVLFAWQKILELGAAIEQVAPGHLLPALKHWLAQIEKSKAEDERVLSDLGFPVPPNGIA